MRKKNEFEKKERMNDKIQLGRWMNTKWMKACKKDETDMKGGGSTPQQA